MHRQNADRGPRGSDVHDMTQEPITLPAYTPSSWELRLPGYPVIVGSFRSSSFPDILGSLPSDSRWKLVFENMTSAEALALLLPWRATGGGLWPLMTLPEELAGGVDDVDFRKRLTGTTWTIEKEPTKESVKNGRFNITIELIYELTFTSIYGPINPLVDLGANPVLMNLSNILSIAGVPIALDPFLPVSRSAGPVLALNLPTAGSSHVAALPIYLDKTVRRNAVLVLSLNLPAELLSVAGLPTALSPLPAAQRSASIVLSLALESGMTVAAISPVKA
jgi:hypothetical protein